MCQPGLPDCSVCHFPLLTGIVSLRGPSQTATVLSLTLQTQSELRKGEFRPAALACWTPRGQEAVWGSNFTERKMWGNCVTQFFFLSPLRNWGHPICKRKEKCEGVGVWMTHLHLQCCLSTAVEYSRSQHSVLSGGLLCLFVCWRSWRKEGEKVLSSVF